MKKSRRPTITEPGVPQEDAPLSPLLAFVVQFREGPDGGPVNFAGRAEHITSGEVVRFRSRADLWRFFTRILITPKAARVGAAGNAASTPLRAPPTPIAQESVAKKLATRNLLKPQ